MPEQIVNTRTCEHCRHEYHSLREETPERCLLCGCRRFLDAGNPQPTENEIAHAEAEDHAEITERTNDGTG